MKRIIALMLALLLSLFAFVACSDDDEEEEEESSSSSVAVGDVPTEEEPDVGDNIVEFN